jgi:hypothetical protein
LTYIVKDEVVQITTLKTLHGKLSTTTYPIGDILDCDLACMPSVGKCKSRAEKADRIIDLLTAIQPKNWCTQGGPGTIDYYPVSQYLVVTHTADVHEQIAERLAALRRTLWMTEEADASAQADKLMRACHDAMCLGQPVKAAHLARRAFVLDPGLVVSDPLVYKLHLLKTWHKKEKPEAEVPVDHRGVCTPPGCPGVRLEANLPRVDPDVVQALDEVLQKAESAETGERLGPPKSEPKGFGGCCGLCELVGCAGGEPKCACKEGKECCCAKGECKCVAGCKGSVKGCDGKCCIKACCGVGCTPSATELEMWQDLCQKLTETVCHDVSIGTDGVRLMLDFEVGGMQYRFKYGVGGYTLTVAPTRIEDQKD